MTEVDARGYSCPIPVVKTKKAMDENPQETLTVLVETEVSKENVSRLAEGRGYTVETAENGLSALGVLKEREVDLVLLDIRMPIKDGLGLLDEITDKLPSLPVIIVTGLASNEEVQEALRRGAFSCLRKPFEIDTLVEEAERALGQREK